MIVSRPRFLFCAFCSLWLVSVGSASAADVQSKLEQLNAREKQLIEKLEAVQQRERYIQTQLEEVRHRKQYYLDLHTVPRPGQPQASPTAPVTPAP